MRYQKIETCIWTDEKFINLTEDAKHLFIYILTSPHSNSLGLYVLPKGYILEDLGWSIQRLGKPFSELLTNGFIKYDESVKLIMICNHLKHNPIENPNQSKGAAKLISRLPQSPLFMDVSKLLGKHFHKELKEQLDERYSKPKEKTKEKTKEILKDMSDSKDKSDLIHWFDFFWKNTWYGSKGSRKKALESLKKIKPAESDLKEMEQARTLQLKFRQEQFKKTGWAENMAHMERWFRDERWKDDLTDGKAEPRRIQLYEKEYYEKYIMQPENKKLIEQGLLVVELTRRA